MCASHQALGRDDFIYQTKPVSFYCVKNPPRQQQVTGNFVSHLPNQNRRDDRGHESDSHFGIAKLRFGDSQRKIAHRRQSRSARDGRSAHCCDGRLGEFVEPAENLRHSLRVLYIVGMRFLSKRLKLFQIHAGTERLTGAGQNCH